MNVPRSRLRLLGLLGLVIALGLGSRRREMPDFVVAYLGDVLWGAMFFVLYALLWPHKRTKCVWSAAVVTTECIELSQLYQAPWAVRIRDTRLGGLLFGHGFSWSDVLCVAVGATLSASLDFGGAQRSKK